MAELKDIRVELDKLDDEFVKLFVKRMSLSEEVAKIKIRDGLPLVHQGREDEIIERLSKDYDEETGEYIKALYLQIFELSRQLQKKLMDSDK